MDLRTTMSIASVAIGLITLTGGTLAYIKVKFNDLKHLDINLKEIKVSLKSLEDKTDKLSDRVSKIEGKLEK